MEGGTRGLCFCGCGEDAPVAPANNAAKGWVRGEPLRYVNGHQQRGRRRPGGGRPRKNGADKRWQDHGRAIDGSSETLRACLLAFGAAPDALGAALGTLTIEELHWGTFLGRITGGPFRKHCRCEEPAWVREELRRVA